MKTYQIEIIEPKAQKLIQELVKLNLIKIKEISEPKPEFKKILKKLRSKSDITTDEITKEVELVRNERYKTKK